MRINNNNENCKQESEFGKDARFCRDLVFTIIRRLTRLQRMIIERRLIVAEVIIAVMTHYATKRLRHL